MERREVKNDVFIWENLRSRKQARVLRQEAGYVMGKCSELPAHMLLMGH